jgi:Tfp pilus assembly protein PilW
MKRRGLWAACVVLILLVGVMAVLAVGAGYAKDEANKDDDAGARCSEATLEGRYLFAYNGYGIKGNDKVPFAVAGYQVFNGNGTQRGVSSFSDKGEVTRNEPVSGTYTVKEDCTGTTTTDGSHSDLFIAPDGSMFTWVYTDPGVVAAGFSLRGTAKRVAP